MQYYFSLAFFINSTKGLFYFGSFAGRTKLPRRPHAAHGSQVEKPWDIAKASKDIIRVLRVKLSFYNGNNLLWGFPC